MTRIRKMTESKINPVDIRITDDEVWSEAEENVLYVICKNQFEAEALKQQILSNEMIVEVLKSHIKKYQGVSIANTNSMIRLDELQSIINSGVKS